MGNAIDTLVVVVTCMLAGNEFAIAAFVHPVFWRLDDVSHARAVQPLARVAGRAMPFWYAAALLLGVAAVVARPTGGASWWLALASALLLAGSIVFTFAGPLPINNRVVAWDLNALPADWRADRRRWDRLHRIRVAILVAAALSVSWAVVLGRS